MARIVVVGSANQDHLVRLSSLPAAGETILAKGVASQPGGKGANQAVAAARLGADVVLVGAVGDDKDGSAIVLQLRTEGVNTGEVQVVTTAPTGLAMVYVLDSGENAIVVVPGANAMLEPARVEQVLRRTCEQGSVVVLQAEVPCDVIDVTARVVEEIGARLVLNLAPYVELAADTLAVADPVVVNETEATSLGGQPVTDLASGAAAARRLTEVARSVVITLGASGAVWADRGADGSTPAPEVAEVVDTAGAGDAFVGALASQLADGADLAMAVTFGVAAGSFSVGRAGAQSSYPVREDLNG